jgi:hypothetical protein
MLASIVAMVDSAVAVSPPPAERFVSSAEKVLEEVFLCEIEESAAAAADQALPRSASKIVQDFLAGFNARKSAPGAALQEDAVISRCVLLSFFCPCAVLTDSQIAQFDRGAEGTMVSGAPGVSPGRRLAYSRPKFVVEQKSEGIPEGTVYIHT